MRVVLDTNVFVIALITRGTPPDRLYQAWNRNRIELVTSAAQINEIIDVLARPRLQKWVDRANAGRMVPTSAGAHTSLVECQFRCGLPTRRMMSF